MWRVTAPILGMEFCRALSRFWLFIGEENLNFSLKLEQDTTNAWYIVNDENEV
jgi:hypothetical protein